MLYRGWVDYLIIKIPVSTWGLSDLKIGAKNQHNKIKPELFTDQYLN